jgi:hypothetical protein
MGLLCVIMEQSTMISVSPLNLSHRHRKIVAYSHMKYESSGLDLNVPL